VIHHHLYRARLALVAALLFSAALVAAEFPLSMLLHQRSELALVASQVSTLQQRNSGLQGDVAALSQDSTIAEIAHEEYGLVSPGQLAYAILPGAGSASANSLAVEEIPPRDLVATANALTPSPRPVAVKGPGLWGRFISHLEFWRSAG
jgi:cell division protein FtsB